MANRENHYEAAFEAFLRTHQVPYVAVDESRRSRLPDGDTVKSLDFIVAASEQGSWLVDVKGRRFPTGDHTRQYWKNWCTRDDLISITQWETLFGAGFRGLLVFAYLVVEDAAPLPPGQMFAYRDRYYGFVGVPIAQYAPRARVISPSWQTVAMPTGEFRRMARPIHDLLALGAEAVC